MRFDDLVQQATGYQPYAYQRRLADQGLPELLRVPTGAGKTLAATLPWLYRRRFHPDASVRASTPHWLVFVLPMRVLVEQTMTAVAGWLRNLAVESDVGLHVVMGGDGRLESAWRAEPERDAVFVGTLDMLLSRALNRGYGTGRFVWPIDFGLFNAGCQWVFDEVQLMGAALPTSRQLEGLRRALGTALPCASTWMSATVDEAWLTTVDLSTIERTVELADADRIGPLRQRLEAAKRVERLDADPARYCPSLARALAAAHRPGTLTIAVMNTVQRARELHDEIGKHRLEAEAVLLHSRFRPQDRADRVDQVLAQIYADGPGRIVVSTQVLEAGVDISAATLFTEAAPWPSVVQRAGRCNRDGAATDARLLWTSPPKPAPYRDEDVEAAAAALAELDGRAVTPPEFGGLDVAVTEVVHPVLRRRDLLGLFDTAPDLSGNDLDVSRFIRDVEDLDVQVAWRSVGDEGPAVTDPAPTRDELCPVPVGELRAALGKRAKDRSAWRFDHLAERWVRAAAEDVRPGMFVVLRAEEGGYTTASGWDPRSRRPVVPMFTDAPSPLAETASATGGDPLTFAPGRWLGLRQHLEDVERAVRDLDAALNPAGLTFAQREAAAIAGRLHDLGKAHPVFQDTLRRAADETERAGVEAGKPWAKSGGTMRSRHTRRYFRHELASALALLGQASAALEGVAEPELVVYLVAAHHGRVRLAIRSLPGETPDGDSGHRVALGVWDGDELPAVAIPGATLPPARLDLSVMELGDGPGGRLSWTARALALRDRPDVGPFRLGFLEALVRVADWRASADGDAPNLPDRAPEVSL